MRAVFTALVFVVVKNFYLNANGVLDAVAIPPNPITPEWNAALTAIVGRANTTVQLLLFSCDGCTNGVPAVPSSSITQATRLRRR